MLINPPNLLTGARIVVIPAMIGAFYIPGDFGKWATCAIFAIAAITDFFDGSTRSPTSCWSAPRS
jgi:cardiolipin synthase (CMP-forming)